MAQCGIGIGNAKLTNLVFFSLSKHLAKEILYYKNRESYALTKKPFCYCIYHLATPKDLHMFALYTSDSLLPKQHVSYALTSLIVNRYSGWKGKHCLYDLMGKTNVWQGMRKCCRQTFISLSRTHTHPLPTASILNRTTFLSHRYHQDTGKSTTTWILYRPPCWTAPKQ